MSCTNPLLAVRLMDDFEGKQVIKILPRRIDMGFDDYAARYGRQNMMMLPCGHCLACISKRKKEWSVRCTMEALDHEQNCFVTLTYDDEHYPGKLVRSDFIGFIKSLRNSGYSVRYFGCGEYGDRTKRGHAHILLFGYFPDDAKPFCKSSKGYLQYTSDFLSNLWKKGLVTVSEFSPFTASYTAGYVVKKFALNDGSFHFQSTRPGIGSSYFFKHYKDIYDTDKIILSFGSHKFAVPRYFDKLAENLGLDLSDIKESRLSSADILTAQFLRDHNMSNTDQMLLQKEAYNNGVLKQSKRSI